MNIFAWANNSNSELQCDDGGATCDNVRIAGNVLRRTWESLPKMQTTGRHHAPLCCTEWFKCELTTCW